MRSLPAVFLTSHLLVQGVSVGAQTCLGAAHSGTARCVGIESCYACLGPVVHIYCLLQAQNGHSMEPKCV